MEGAVTEPTATESRDLREINWPATNRCPNGCKERDGKTPRSMRTVVGASPKVKRLPSGETKQVTVQVTVKTCDRCGEQVRTEQEI
jgi:hypothetical protein